MGSNSVLSLGLCLLAQVGWAQVVIPETPAGENLTAMLGALNSRDRQSIENYVERYGGSGSVDQVLGTIEQIGELRIASVVESDRLRIAFVAEAPAIGLRFVGMFAVEDSEPPVLAYSVPWTVLPPDKTVIGFDIDEAAREGVIEEIAARLGDEYVLEDVALEMADWLRERLRGGGYDAIDNGALLANTLTEELRGISGDKHLGVYFSPVADGPPTPSPYTRGAIAAGDCGFEEVEQPEDKVAYVKVYEFLDQCRQRGEAILRALSGSDAIVFDLTDTIGGNWGIWGLFINHFVEPTQLSSLHWRAAEYVQRLSLDERLEGLNFGDADIYVLTSSRTFSGGEGFAYDLQASQRATVIGEVTAGGAHATRSERIDERFDVALPWARVVNPITGSNWEGSGVQPDVAVPADEALTTALGLIRRQSP